MMYEMRKKKPEPTLLPTERIFYLPCRIGLIWEKLAFDDTLSYIHHREMDCSIAKCYGGERDSNLCPQSHLPRALTD